MLQADEIQNNQRNINGKWVAVKPVKGPWIVRLKDAVQVLRGKAEAVRFEEE